MLAGIREILIITTPHDAAQFRALLGDGSAWGLELQYAIQPSPDGLAQAFLIGRDFIDGSRSALVLGDNLFYGQGFQAILRRAAQSRAGAVIFGYWVRDPTPYGVIDMAPNGAVRGIVEKPAAPPSNYAVTGLYFYDQHVSDIAATLRPSARGELEITGLNNCYLREGKLELETLGQGFAWLDIGTPESLLHAAEFVATVEARQGLKIACPEEVAWRQNWIEDAHLEILAANLKSSAYARYLQELLELGR
jgi:glucose-1-phosphate thymidylyltransferase